ncbi:hypothetical protein KC360_g234 [Hortaea werneckii]|nr:hypothetical protein KC360_g234 [Hortaea werneckii]
MKASGYLTHPNQRPQQERAHAIEASACCKNGMTTATPWGRFRVRLHLDRLCGWRCALRTSRKMGVIDESQQILSSMQAIRRRGLEYAGMEPTLPWYVESQRGVSDMRCTRAGGEMPASACERLILESGGVCRSSVRLFHVTLNSRQAVPLPGVRFMLVTTQEDALRRRVNCSRRSKRRSRCSVDPLGRKVMAVNSKDVKTVERWVMSLAVE